jgi:hypothetical protein
MADNARFEELSLTIQALSEEDKEVLARRISQAEIKRVFDDIKQVIAQEAMSRVQSKIALRFNKGYGIGELFNSIYFKVEGDTITVSSTKNYFAILNEGIRSFDMKKNLANRVKMRLPGGAIIYRSAPAKDGQDPRKKKSPLAKASWIYPGISGAHIYEIVAEEMKTWMTDYVNTEVRKLLDRAKGRDQDYYGTSKAGRQYNNVRNLKGQFAASKTANTSFNRLLQEEHLHSNYEETAIGAMSPVLPNTGKYVRPGQAGALKERPPHKGVTYDEYHLDPLNWGAETRFDKPGIQQKGYHIGKSVLQTNAAKSILETNGSSRPKKKRK